MKAAVASYFAYFKVQIFTSRKSFLFASCSAVEIVSNMLEFFLVYALLSTITTKVSIEEEGGTKKGNNK